jgi:Amt family ammonium transporter
VFYGGSGKQLGMQLLGVVVITAWTCTLAGALFLLLKKASPAMLARRIG